MNVAPKIVPNSVIPSEAERSEAQSRDLFIAALAQRKGPSTPFHSGRDDGAL
jgi:hypothetical protein